MVTFNEASEISKIFKGKFRIYDGSTPYDYDQIVSLVETINANYAVHYSTQGAKRVIGTGNNSQYTLTVDNTTSLYDSTETPGEDHSISYFVSKILENKNLPIIVFEGIEITEAAKKPTITSKFTGVVVGTELSRNPTTGTYERTIIIEIEKFEKMQRS